MGMKGGWLMVQRMGLSILLMGGMKITTHVIIVIKSYEGGSWKDLPNHSALDSAALD